MDLENIKSIDEEKSITEEEIAKIIADVADILSDRRALEIETMKVRELTSIADYFIVCTGTSSTHLKGLADEVEHSIEKKYHIRPHHIEGYDSASWILVDYGFLIVHIFHQDSRKFYSLERLWSDAPKHTYTEKKI